MTDDNQEISFDKEFVRRGAESITEEQVRQVAEREAEIRARFERPGPIGRVLSDISLALALVKDYWNKDYRQVPWWAIAAVTFCCLYVVNPVDLLPDCRLPDGTPVADYWPAVAAQPLQRLHCLEENHFADRTH